MSRYPRATWAPVDRYQSGSLHIPMNPGRLILHTAVSASSSMHGFFNTDGQATPHFYVNQSGWMEQYIDTNFQSTANLQGNHDSITVESWDGYPSGWANDSDVPDWTPGQIEALAKLAAWCRSEHGIPSVQLSSSRAGTKGIGWHRLGIDGNFPGGNLAGRISGGETWTTSPGKVCPGDRKILSTIGKIIPRAGGLPDVDPDTDSGGGSPDVPAPPPTTHYEPPGEGWIDTVTPAGSRTRGDAPAVVPFSVSLATPTRGGQQAWWKFTAPRSGAISFDVLMSMPSDGSGQTPSIPSVGLWAYEGQATTAVKFSGTHTGPWGPGATVTTTTTNTAPTTTETDSSPSGIARYMYAMRMHESGGDYTIDNGVGATGAYQYMDGTWNNYQGYARAMDAPREVQDERMRTDSMSYFNGPANRDWLNVACIHFIGHLEPKSVWSTYEVPGENPTITEFTDDIRERMANAPEGLGAGPDHDPDGPDPEPPLQAPGPRRGLIVNQIGQTAIDHAQAQVDAGTGGHGGYCLLFVQGCYAAAGIPTPSQGDAANGSRNSAGMHRTTDYSTIPAGVPIWWTGGSQGYGHVALSTGNGNCISTDHPTYDVANNTTIASCVDWLSGSHTYQGWSEFFTGTRIWDGDGSQYEPPLGDGGDGGPVPDDDIPDDTTTTTSSSTTKPNVAQSRGQFFLSAVEGRTYYLQAWPGGGGSADIVLKVGNFGKVGPWVQDPNVTTIFSYGRNAAMDAYESAFHYSRNEPTTCNIEATRSGLLYGLPNGLAFGATGANFANNYDVMGGPNAPFWRYATTGNSLEVTEGFANGERAQCLWDIGSMFGWGYWGKWGMTQAFYGPSGSDGDFDINGNWHAPEAPLAYEMGAINCGWNNARRVSEHGLGGHVWSMFASATTSELDVSGDSIPGALLESYHTGSMYVYSWNGTNPANQNLPGYGTCQLPDNNEHDGDSAYLSNMGNLGGHTCGYQYQNYYKHGAVYPYGHLGFQIQTAMADVNIHKLWFGLGRDAGAHDHLPKSHFGPAGVAFIPHAAVAGEAVEWESNYCEIVSVAVAPDEIGGGGPYASGASVDWYVGIGKYQVHDRDPDRWSGVTFDKRFAYGKDYWGPYILRDSGWDSLLYRYVKNYTSNPSGPETWMAQLDFLQSYSGGTSSWHEVDWEGAWTWERGMAALLQGEGYYDEYTLDEAAVKLQNNIGGLHLEAFPPGISSPTPPAGLGPYPGPTTPGDEIHNPVASIGWTSDENDPTYYTYYLKDGESAYPERGFSEAPNKGIINIRRKQRDLSYCALKVVAKPARYKLYYAATVPYVDPYNDPNNEPPTDGGGDGPGGPGPGQPGGPGGPGAVRWLRSDVLASNNVGGVGTAASDGLPIIFDRNPGKRGQ